MKKNKNYLPSDAILSIRGLTAGFRAGWSNKIEHIFSDLNVTFKRGFIHAVTGPSGSGKSTFLQIIAGFAQPLRGTVRVQEGGGALLGESSSATMQAFFGSVFQQPVVIDEFSVLENVLVRSLFDDKMANSVEVAGWELLKKAGLEKYAAEHPRALSIGQRQRLCLARALYQAPSFLFLDEPTAGLDQETATVILELLRMYCQKEQAAIIIATHDLSIIESADTVFDIFDGDKKI